MAFVDHEFYADAFNGAEIPQDEFDRLADDASEIIKSIVQREISAEDAVSEDIKRAACYQIEYMFEAGGSLEIENAMLDGAISSEKLGDFSETRTRENLTHSHSVGGFPASSMTVNILRRMGYMSRWAYSRGGG